MKFFKPTDFYGMGGDFSPHLMADMVNAKLEREGKVVYSNKAAYTWRPGDESDDYKALLINIESIEKCTHPNKKIGKIIGVSDIYFECECGAKVKPKEFEEVK